jgi:hypothetical protein
LRYLNAESVFDIQDPAIRKVNWSVNTVAIFTWKGKLPSDEEVGANPTSRYSADSGEQWAY